MIISLFNIVIANTSLVNMTTINASLFNADLQIETHSA